METKNFCVEWPNPIFHLKLLLTKIESLLQPEDFLRIAGFYICVEPLNVIDLSSRFFHNKMAVDPCEV